jgi:hypothetical protein
VLGDTDYHPPSKRPSRPCLTKRASSPARGRVRLMHFTVFRFSPAPVISMSVVPFARVTASGTARLIFQVNAQSAIFAINATDVVGSRRAMILCPVMTSKCRKMAIPSGSPGLSHPMTKSEKLGRLLLPWHPAQREQKHCTKEHGYARDYQEQVKAAGGLFHCHSQQQCAAGG